jgi:hypothetical protein
MEGNQPACTEAAFGCCGFPVVWISDAAAFWLTTSLGSTNVMKDGGSKISDLSACSVSEAAIGFFKVAFSATDNAWEPFDGKGSASRIAGISDWVESTGLETTKWIELMET